VRLLSNFETKQDKLLQIILVGQPELGDQLNEPRLRQLKQRIALRHHLSCLNLSECKEYIAKRLQIAGVVASLFSEGAIEAIHHYSGGTPRLINIICDNGLLSAYSLRKPAVEPIMIEEIAQDLQLTVPRRRLVNKRKSLITKAKELSARDRVEPSPECEETAEVERQQLVNGTFTVETIAKAEPIAEPVSVDHQGPTGTAEAASGDRSGDEPVSAFVPEALFLAMINALTEATGPMAAVIVWEHVRAMGESKNAFPMRRLQQLLDQTSSEIANDAMRERFRRRMCEEIFSFNAGISRE
jgi:hypothetical protein